jgi:hypothetical protein
MRDEKGERRKGIMKNEEEGEAEGGRLKAEG